MNIITKDILSVRAGIIAHQVNLIGVMGAGLARKIAIKYPAVYQTYQRELHDYNLGDVQYVQVSDSLKIANLFAQQTVSRSARMTDYHALGRCLELLNSRTSVTNQALYLPYGIGCGLGGGDWDVVSSLIEEKCPNAIVCKWR